MSGVFNNFNDDTICAVATAMSDSGIGVIRVSGKDAVAICDKIYRSAKMKQTLKEHAPNTIKYGYVCDGEKIIDEVMISFMKAPHSFTREDVIEINSHGGVLIMNQIIELLLKSGCRLADPGEFTKRAFLNGRIDLTKAEAIMDIISAQNNFALDSSRNQLRGSIYDKVKSLREQIIYEMAFIESALDDPENYDLTGYPEKLKAKVSDLTGEIEKLLSTADEGKIRKDGIKTVIVGKPNAGKSSLLNTLIGDERAIVLHLIDTAGIRDTDDIIEKMGVDKAKSKIEEADLVLYILDSTRDIDDEDKEIISLCADKKTIILLNKNDLSDDIKINEDNVFKFFTNVDNVPVIKTSMLKGNGIDELKDALSKLFFNGDILPKQEIYITNLRHKELLQKVYGSLKLVDDSISKNLSEDFYTVDLSNAYAYLGEIIGEEVSDDLVDKIFSEFCMGK